MHKDRTLLEKLVCVEKIDGQWAVVFYPYLGCLEEFGMCLSYHRKKEFADHYRKQFINTMIDYGRD